MEEAGEEAQEVGNGPGAGQGDVGPGSSALGRLEAWVLSKNLQVTSI